MTDDERVHLTAKIVRRISPLLRGQDPHVIGAVLADLTAMWIAGHVSPGNPEETERLRAALFSHHVAGVAGLIHINAEQSGAALVAAKAAGRG